MRKTMIAVAIYVLTMFFAAYVIYSVMCNK